MTKIAFIGITSVIMETKFTEIGTTARAFLALIALLLTAIGMR